MWELKILNKINIIINGIITKKYLNIKLIKSNKLKYKKNNNFKILNQ